MMSISRGVICATVFAAAAIAGPAAHADARQTESAAAKAAAASPELVGALSKELGSTPEQAAGAAGALFGVAKSRLKPEEFSQVSSAVPGMATLLSAAPAAGGATGTSGAAAALSGAAKSAGAMASAASAFSKLGLKPELVSKAIPVLTSFVSKSGGANVASLLAGALK